MEMEMETEAPHDISSFLYAHPRPFQHPRPLLKSNQTNQRDPPVESDSVPRSAVKDPPRRPPSPTSPTLVMDLGSTVPDSQLPTHFPPASQSRHRQPGSGSGSGSASKSFSLVQNMISQGSAAATQELSPSHFATIISRSRSAAHLLSNRFAGDEDTQPTLHEGDEGHIDIVSSLTSPQHHAAKDTSSNPGDFSPSQSQHQLVQYPESQRFKTPGTIARKRRYNGDMIESPELPRAPLLRDPVAAHPAVMELSQAFAATQADTSPAPDTVGRSLHSDQPSPGILVQPRPVAAASSSPNLQLLTSVPRASTEPASRYVSVKQSQDKRARQSHLPREPLVCAEDESSDDGFGAPDSVPTHRRRLQIERRAQAGVARLSPSSDAKRSARIISPSKSSPIPSPSRLLVDAPQFLSMERPHQISRAAPSTESEEETEQEEENAPGLFHVNVAQSSQPHFIHDDENKENCSGAGSQIPETTARLVRVLNELPPQSQDSPSVRHGRRAAAQSQPAALYSSDHFAVADSQPSQSQIQYLPRRGQTQSRPSVLLEGADFVPQSPAETPPTGARSPDNEMLVLSDSDGDGDEAGPPKIRCQDNAMLSLDDGADGEADHAPNDISPDDVHQHPVTVPETSSNERPYPSVSRMSISGDGPNMSESGRDFETAPSRMPPSEAHVHHPTDDILSSPPIATTPPGRKRKRMADIAAEPSPLKSQVSFDASAALRVEQPFQHDTREGIAGLIAPSMSRPQSQRLHSPVGPAVRYPESPSKPARPAGSQDPSARQEPDNLARLRQRQDLVERHVTSVSQYPQRERKPSAKLRLTMNPQQSTTTTSRRPSQWDLEPSPPPKFVPRIAATLSNTKAQQITSPADQNTAGRPLRLKQAQSRFCSDTTSPLSELDEDVSSFTSHSHDEVPAPSSPTSGGAPLAPNMVFACFNGKSRAYYPALCLGHCVADPKRFVVQWEGYEPDEVDLRGVRSLDLRPGDQVKVNLPGFPKVPYVVRGFSDQVAAKEASSDWGSTSLTDIYGHKALLIAPKQRKSLPSKISTEVVKQVPVASIYLDSNMWIQLRDRSYQYKASTAIGPTSMNSTPMDRRSPASTPPSRQRRAAAPAESAYPTTASVRSGGVFANMAFAISYDDDLRKSSLQDLIHSNGGQVLKDSFLDLLEHDEIKLQQPYRDWEFAALLTDRHSRKEKFMQALALGLPCLSGKWVEACARSERRVDWTSYLLPAGESAELEGATRSRVLPAMYGKASTKLNDLVASRPQIFDGARVIVVTGKGKTENRRRPYLFLIRALGAGAVETEPDLAAAKARLAQAERHVQDGVGVATWVLVDDREVGAAKGLFSSVFDRNQKSFRAAGEGGAGHRETRVNIMCIEDVVQSLILGKLWPGC